MNYFITNKGVESVELDAHSLFLHMELGVLGNTEVKTFNLFKELIELPSVVFRHRKFDSFDLHRDYGIIATGNYPVAEAKQRIEENYAKGRCSVIHHVTHEEKTGDMVRVYIMCQSDYNILMRPAVIDSILLTL